MKVKIKTFFEENNNTHSLLELFTDLDEKANEYLETITGTYKVEPRDTILTLHLEGNHIKRVFATRTLTITYV